MYQNIFNNCPMFSLDWEEKVRDSIPKDWLDLIENSDRLTNRHLHHIGYRISNFNSIMDYLYRRYKPQVYGSWKASPRWQDLFSWTACPVKKVRAVILIMRPKTDSNGWRSRYKRSGYGARVQPKSGFTDRQRVSEIGTVWSMLEVARQCLQYPEADLEALVANKYQNGFNPECLSQLGIVFLNVAMTTGHTGKEDDGDMIVWQQFALKLLDVFPGKNIPLFLWYTSKAVEWKLPKWDGAQFVVSKPNDLDLVHGPHQHIGDFNADQIRNYVKELSDQKYLKHKAILARIYKSIVCECKMQPYLATIEECCGIMW